MLKLNCNNGSFEIDHIRESRNFSDGRKLKFVDITVSNQDITMDEIEAILTEPVITGFEIINEKTGLVIGQFEGYTLNNISKDSHGNTINIVINFMKGNENG